MGLAFAGGFASGLSTQIDKYQKRKSIREEREAEKISQVNSTIAANQEDQYKLQVSTRDAMDKVNAEIEKNKADSKLTPKERIDKHNRLNRSKMDIFKSASERSVQIGDGNPTGVVDMANENVEQLGTVSVDGKKYIIDYGTASQIQQSNGALGLDGNEIVKRVMEQNSEGQLVPVKNSDGSFKMESTGQFLKPYGDVFSGGEVVDLKTTSTGISSMMSADEKTHFDGLGLKPDAVTLKMHEDYTKQRTKSKLEGDGNKKKEVIGTDFIDTRLDPKSENAITWGTPVSGKDIVEARAATPKGAKMDATMKRELTGKLGIYSDGAKIIEYISENDVDFDLGETAKTEIAKATGFADWKELIPFLGKDPKKDTPEDKVIRTKANAMMLNRITADTALQNMVANYVKIISGAAVTDQERQTFYGIITAGKYADETAMLTAMTSFVDSVGGNFRNTLDTIKYDNPAEYVTSVKAWNDADKSTDISKYRKRNEAKMNTDSNPNENTPVATEVPETKGWRQYLPNKGN